jgi:hypothetical protein
MEKELIYKIRQTIPELNSNIAGQTRIYAVNAPKLDFDYCLVYMQTDTNRDKTLKGFIDNNQRSYLFNLIAKDYATMIDIRNKLEDLLMDIPLTFIGETSTIYVEDININRIQNTWENEIECYRGIIDFTIYFH